LGVFCVDLLSIVYFIKFNLCGLCVLCGEWILVAARPHCENLRPIKFKMKLYVFGSGTCIPTVERGPSGLALAIGPHLILLDGGSGSLRQMVRMGLDFRRVDYLFLSHFHPDHVAEFVPLLFAMNYTVDFTRVLPLQVIGPKGLRNFYDQLQGIFGRWIEAQTYPLFFQEVEESHLPYPDFTVETLPMAHSAAAVGFRLNGENRSVVYSGDTDYCSNIVRLGRNADLLVLECSFPDERKAEGHLTPSLAGKIAREASCKKLLLTHFYPVFQGHDIRKECSKEFDGDIILAEDGMRLNI
jgi:ribonuclease BN (tRNA processing enzyme)